MHLQQKIAAGSGTVSYLSRFWGRFSLAPSFSHWPRDGFHVCAEGCTSGTAVTHSLLLLVTRKQG